MENEKTPVFVVYVDGTGDYCDAPEGYSVEEYVDALKAETAIKGVYRTCTNAGPYDPFWERDGNGIVDYLRNDGGFHYDADKDPKHFAEAYRDFIARFDTGKLAPLRLDGDEKDGKAYYACPAMNGIYVIGIKDGKAVSVSLF